MGGLGQVVPGLSENWSGVVAWPKAHWWNVEGREQVGSVLRLLCVTRMSTPFLTLESFERLLIR